MHYKPKNAEDEAFARRPPYLFGAARRQTRWYRAGLGSDRQPLYCMVSWMGWSTSAWLAVSFEEADCGQIPSPNRDRVLHAMLSTFGTDLGEVALSPGTGGVFEITCDGTTNLGA